MLSIGVGNSQGISCNTVYAYNARQLEKHVFHDWIRNAHRVPCPLDMQGLQSLGHFVRGVAKRLRADLETPARETMSIALVAAVAIGQRSGDAPLAFLLAVVKSGVMTHPAHNPLEERSFCILHHVNKLVDQWLLPSFDFPSRRNHVEEFCSVDLRKLHLSS
ncbi:MAG TPA: hypothetical protein VE988_17840 [Gemmataceae bacterium]|nr:hypothetical protein [Gemmataceae bacterium]